MKVHPGVDLEKNSWNGATKDVVPFVICIHQKNNFFYVWNVMDK